MTIDEAIAALGESVSTLAEKVDRYALTQMVTNPSGELKEIIGNTLFGGGAVTPMGNYMENLWGIGKRYRDRKKSINDVKPRYEAQLSALAGERDRRARKAAKRAGRGASPPTPPTPVPAPPPIPVPTPPTPPTPPGTPPPLTPPTVPIGGVPTVPAAPPAVPVVPPPPTPPGGTPPPGTPTPPGGVPPSPGGKGTPGFPDVDVPGPASAALTVGAHIASFGTAVLEFGKATYQFARAQEQEVRRLAEFGPQQAQGIAELDMNRVLRDFKKAGDTGDSSKELTSAIDKFEDALLPITTAVTNLANVVASSILNTITEILSWLEPIADALNALLGIAKGPTPDTNWKALEDIADRTRRTLNPNWP